MHIAVVGLRGMHNVIGGIETHCRNLYPALARRRPDIEFTVFERNAYHHADDGYPANLKVRSLWAPQLPAVEAFVHTLIAILIAGVKLRPDILHIHAIGPGIWTPLARILGMKVIVTIHARDYDRPKWSWPIVAGLKLGEWLSCRFADAVVCVSQAGLADIQARHPHHAARFYAIPHGSGPLPVLENGEGEEIFEELGVKPGGYVLAVGRYDKTKRFHDLVKARAGLGGDAMPLVIVGSAIGDHEAARELNAEGVVLAGSRFEDQLAQLYRNASLFIHPSQMEGFGLVVLEAMNAEVPVALSDLPQHREFGLPDHCYFPVGDVAAIAVIMGHADHGAFKPKIDEAVLTRFTLTDMIKKYERLFDDVAQGRETV